MTANELFGASCGTQDPAPACGSGDPILHPNFWELLELFEANNLRFCIMGNPFHLTDQNCRRMKECGCVKYQLSPDGLERTHDMFRKPDSFKTMPEKISVIKASGMWCAVMRTVSKTNMNEIPDLIDLMDESLCSQMPICCRFCCLLRFVMLK